MYQVLLVKQDIPPGHFHLGFSSPPTARPRNHTITNGFKSSRSRRPASPSLPFVKVNGSFSFYERENEDELDPRMLSEALRPFGGKHMVWRFCVVMIRNLPSQASEPQNFLPEAKEKRIGTFKFESSHELGVFNFVLLPSALGKLSLTSAMEIHVSHIFLQLFLMPVIVPFSVLLVSSNPL